MHLLLQSIRLAKEFLDSVAPVFSAFRKSIHLKI